MKQCSKCTIIKPEEDFAFRNKSKGIRRAECKECIRRGDKIRYQSLERKTAIRDNAVKRKQELVDKLWAYKQGKKCADCPQTDPRTFEFDHLPQYQKSNGIAVMVQNLHSWQSIQKEIAKCEIVCASCHRIRTWERAGWVRNIIVN